MVFETLNKLVESLFAKQDNYVFQEEIYHDLYKIVSENFYPCEDNNLLCIKLQNSRNVVDFIRSVRRTIVEYVKEHRAPEKGLEYAHCSLHLLELVLSCENYGYAGMIREWGAINFKSEAIESSFIRGNFAPALKAYPDIEAAVDELMKILNISNEDLNDIKMENIEESETCSFTGSIMSISKSNEFEDWLRKYKDTLPDSIREILAPYYIAQTPIDRLMHEVLFESRTFTTMDEIVDIFQKNNLSNYVKILLLDLDSCDKEPLFIQVVFSLCSCVLFNSKNIYKVMNSVSELHIKNSFILALKYARFSPCKVSYFKYILGSISLNHGNVSILCAYAQENGIDYHPILSTYFKKAAILEILVLSNTFSYPVTVSDTMYAYLIDHYSEVESFLSKCLTKSDILYVKGCNLIKHNNRQYIEHVVRHENIIKHPDLLEIVLSSDLSVTALQHLLLNLTSSDYSKEVFQSEIDNVLFKIRHKVCKS